MRECVDCLLRDEEMGKFIKRVDSREHYWEALALLPFYAKGIGIARLEQERKHRFTSVTPDR